MTQNTVLSDINEIMLGYFLAGNSWSKLGNEAKSQYEMRVKQALPTEVEDAVAKAKIMAQEFIKWASKNGYSSNVKNVWWTARPGSMSSAVGYKVDQSKNPTDILVKFSSGPNGGFLGASAKATKRKTDIGFKNPGLGTLEASLKINLSDEHKKAVDEIVKKFELSPNASTRKKQIRANPIINAKTTELGSKLLSNMRDKLLPRLQKMSQSDLVKYLITDWMDADISLPPYIKVTGMGNKPPYSAMIMDPLANEKLSALSKYKIILEKVGNESIGVMAGTKKIMKIRFKFESQKLASTIKLSGEPW
jgi:hypothetical protein